MVDDIGSHLLIQSGIWKHKQHGFAIDWMVHNDEYIRDTLLQPMLAPEPGFAAQVITSGLCAGYFAVPKTFENWVYSERFLSPRFVLCR